MNGKKAKALRKLAQILSDNMLDDTSDNGSDGGVEMPTVKYKDIHHTKTRLTVNFKGNPVPEEYTQITKAMVPYCTRSWYKAMKLGHKQDREQRRNYNGHTIFTNQSM